MKIKCCSEIFKKYKMYRFSECDYCYNEDEKICLGILYLPNVIWRQIKNIIKNIIEKIKTKIYFIAKGWDDIPF